MQNKMESMLMSASISPALPPPPALSGYVSSSSSSPIHRNPSCTGLFPPSLPSLALSVLASRGAMVNLIPSPQIGFRKPSLLLRHSRPLPANRKTLDKPCPEEHELDQDLRTGLNEVSTEAVKVMLSDNKRLVDSFKEKVEYVRKYLMQEGHLEAADFMVVIRGMLDHKVIPEKDNLEGVYKKAFERIWALLEDSGWLLTLPDDTSAVEMVDEEPMPPVLETPS